MDSAFENYNGLANLRRRIRAAKQKMDRADKRGDSHTAAKAKMEWEDLCQKRDELIKEAKNNGRGE